MKEHNYKKKGPKEGEANKAKSSSKLRNGLREERGEKIMCVRERS